MAIISHGNIVYALEAKNYKDLVRSSNSVLIVLWLPKDIDGWLQQDATSLRIFNCAYYYKITRADRRDIPNKESKTIYIPSTQILTGDALLQLIDEIQPREP